VGICFQSIFITLILPDAHRISIVMGEHNAKSDNDCEVDICSDPLQMFEPKRIIVHKDYDKPDRQNDLALIQLNKDAKFTGNLFLLFGTKKKYLFFTNKAWVLPLCLPQNQTLKNSFINEKADVAGWGLTDSDNKDGSEILKTVKVCSV
jgi:hypothetical protein